jgi:hypothetical protein
MAEGENGANPDEPVQVAIQVQMTQVQVRLFPDNRPALIAVPVDVTDVEMLAFIGAALQVSDQLRAARVASQLVVAKTMPTPPRSI